MVSGRIRMPDTPLVVGAFRLDAAFPIIGPPKITFAVLQGMPPAASITADRGVPIGTM